MDLKSLLAVVGLVWRRGLTPPPGPLPFPVAPAEAPAVPVAD